MERYTTLLSEYLELFEHLIQLEKDKRDIVIARDLAALEEIMKKEQAGIMKLKGMEQRRLRMQDDLGIGNKTFRQIIQDVDDEARLVLTPLFHNLEESIKQFKVTNESTSEVLEAAIHDLDLKLGKDPAEDISVSTRTV